MKFPSQIAGIRYTRNMVNGQNINQFNEAAMLGSITIGMIAE